MTRVDGDDPAVVSHAAACEYEGMPHRLVKLLGGLVLLPLMLYLGDWAVWSLRAGMDKSGGAMGTVAVSSATVASLKGNKVEYYTDPTVSVACSQSLFPQAGASACWWLRRHARVVVEMQDGYSK